MAVSRLCLEAYGQAAADRLARLIAEAKMVGALAPVTVAVPTQYAGLSLRRALASGQGLANVRFMVPSRLAEYLGAPALAKLGKAPLTRLLEQETVRAAAHDVGSSGPLAPVARHPRLHSSLATTFRHLSRLSDGELARVAGTDALRSQIVRWYRAFRDRLGGYYSPEELAWAAARAVEEGKAAGALRDLGLVVFHLVPAFSPGEAALVKALGAVGRCAVVLGLTGDEEADAVVRRTATGLETVLGPARLAPPPQGSYDAHHLVSAPDIHEEVKWVVRHISSRAEKGLPFHRMAVLYRQPEPYASLAMSQLRLARIPVAGPDPAPLRETPAGRLLESLVSVVESGFSRDSVMQWVAESPVGTGAEGLAASGELARWEAISRMAGVVKGMDQWRERLARYRESLARQRDAAESIDEATPSRLRGLRELETSAAGLLAFVEGLWELSPPAGGGRWEEYAEWDRRILKKYAQEPGQWPDRHESSYRRLMDLLDDISGLDTVSPEGTDLAGFHLTLREALEASSGRAGLTGSGVFVAPAAAAQGMQFDVVYLVGMAEGGFPSRVPDDPILPDAVREEAGNGAALPLRDARRSEERRLFVAALASGAQRVLSYSRTDTSAQRGQHPSPWFLAAAGRLRGRAASAADLARLADEGWISVIHSSEHSLEYARSLAPADIHDYDVASAARWRAMGRRLGDHYLAAEGGVINRFLAMERGRRGTDFTAWDGRLLEMAGKSRRLSPPRLGEVSPTRLERWAVCPFRYFMGDVLDLSALERPEELLAISPLDRGVVLHDILERFVRAAMARGDLPGHGEPWSTSHLDLLLKIAGEEFDKAEARGITGKALLWQAAKEELRQDLEAFLEMDSRWRAEAGARPLWVERVFGFPDQGSLPPVSLTLPGGSRVQFRGRIDRVDSLAGSSNLVVIDYKSGRADYYRDMKDDPLGGGRHLQLPVYALAALSASTGAAEVEAQYWFVTTRGNFERRAVPLAQVKDRFLDVVQSIVSGIEAGLFPANPGPPGRDGRPENCGYCDFDRVCPADRDVLWARKRGNPELAPYLRLTGPADTEGNTVEEPQ